MPYLSDFLPLAKEGSWQVHLCRGPIWTLFSGGLYRGRLLLDNCWPCTTRPSCSFLAFISLSVWPRVPRLAQMSLSVWYTISLPTVFRTPGWTLGAGHRAEEEASWPLSSQALRGRLAGEAGTGVLCSSV